MERLTLIALLSSKTWLTMTLATELQVQRETEEKKQGVEKEGEINSIFGHFN